MTYSIALCSVWIVLVCAAVLRGSIDNRRCTEKLQGPLNEFDTSSHVLHLEASATNYFTVTVSCRTVCQENGASYAPHLRIVTTEDGQFYEGRWDRASHLFRIDVPRSNNRYECDATNNVTIHRYHVTVIDHERFNRSIVMCALFYVSSSDSDYSEYCYTDRVAWITVPKIHDPPANSTITTSMSTTTTSTSTAASAETTQHTTLPTDEIQTNAEVDPFVMNTTSVPTDESTIITVAVLVPIIVSLLIILLVVVVVLCCKKNHKKAQTWIDSQQDAHIKDISVSSRHSVRLPQHSQQSTTNNYELIANPNTNEPSDQNSKEFKCGHGQLPNVPGTTTEADLVQQQPIHSDTRL